MAQSHMPLDGGEKKVEPSGPPATSDIERGDRVQAPRDRPSGHGLMGWYELRSIVVELKRLFDVVSSHGWVEVIIFCLVVDPDGKWEIAKMNATFSILPNEIPGVQQRM